MSKPLALIVHSSAETGRRIARVLDRLDVDSHITTGLPDASDRLEQEDYALCLTDVDLTEGTGLQLVEHIQTHHPLLTTAVVTAHGTLDAAVAALKAGAVDFLCLPIDDDAMHRFLSGVLPGTSPASQQHRERRTRHILLGSSAPMRRIRGTISKLAQTDASVFISGESGTGKELAARLIHARGPRSSGPFVAVNCGAIPQELMESEFFGHQKGSFTGATADKIGLFQAASGGVLFLDEVADLPANMQVKLLRALQEKAIRPVGGAREFSVDVRVVSATHKELDALVAKRAFRQDLFYRINVIELHMPPLRERHDDIPMLVEHTLQRLSLRMGIIPPAIAGETMDRLCAYPFPGNVRELENIIERALTLCNDTVIAAADLRLPQPDQPNPGPSEDQSLDEYLLHLERTTILRALEATGWNKTKAARKLGISFRSLRYRLEKLGLKID